MQQDHFQGKTVAQHLQEKRVEEVHGTFLSLPLSHFLEAICATVFLFSIVIAFLSLFHFTVPLYAALLFSLGLALGLAGRSGWTSWRRLERLTRLMQQEKYEIEHHRPQEREELITLYSAKGFKPPLLDQVVDFLMADNDRLLKVMLEEEMGLNLNVESHPLQQVFAAFTGALVASFAMLFFSEHPFWLFSIATILIALCSGWTAKKEGNLMLPSVLWGMSILWLAIGAIFLLGNFLLQ